MEQEEVHWIQAYDDFINSPANGIRGKSAKRRNEYVEQDRNILKICRTREERTPVDFLKAISYRLPNPA